MPPGATPLTAVDLAITVAGDVGSFDQPTFRANLLTQFPSASDVIITNVISGSIVVGVSIVFAQKDDAVAAQSVLGSTTTADMTAQWFGGSFTVEATTAQKVKK